MRLLTAFKVSVTSNQLNASVRISITVVFNMPDLIKPIQTKSSLLQIHIHKDFDPLPKK